MITGWHHTALGCGVLALLLAVPLSGAQSARKTREANRASAAVFHTRVPDHPGSIVLGRPTGTAITLSLLLHKATEGVVVWGTDEKALASGRQTVSLQAGVPQPVVLDGLSPDTRYYYELRDRADGRRLLPQTGPGTFHTARPPGTTFTFTITADSHLDGNTDPAVYRRTLASALADAPDFHVELGDTFMTEKHENRESAAQQYLAQRFYFGQLCASAPLFLVLGNHDGESPRGRGSDADSLAVWSNQMRKRYFPNPVPDSFFTGNAAKHPEAGLLQDYYAWEWGDALCVVLDPFWFTQQQRGQRDNWSRTLGAEQYQWLKRTLEASRAKFKFIFTHHLVGGLDPQCRGGSEAALLYEWGGRNVDGTDDFRQHRPGWSAPIHPLLVQDKVNIVFHGHDHLYARQELEGVVYQEVPQPGNPGNARAPRNAAAYGYRSGTLLGGSGYLRLKVSPNQATVEYVETGSSDRKQPSEGVLHRYSIPPH